MTPTLSGSTGDYSLDKFQNMHLSYKKKLKDKQICTYKQNSKPENVNCRIFLQKPNNGKKYDKAYRTGPNQFKFRIPIQLWISQVTGFSVHTYAKSSEQPLDIVITET